MGENKARPAAQPGKFVEGQLRASSRSYRAERFPLFLSLSLGVEEFQRQTVTWDATGNNAHFSVFAR
jgi:hypothetical protein